MKVKCPVCKKELEWDTKNPYRPFCSKKCQLIDFGTWANEENAIAGSDAMSSVEGQEEDLTR